MISLLAKVSLPKGFSVFAALVCFILILLEIVNHRLWLNDFRVYYDTASGLFNGSDLYGVSRGLDSGFYKYSPFVLLLFIPFTLFQFEVAAIIYYLLVVGFIFGVFILLKRLLSGELFNAELFKKSIPFIIIFLFAFGHIYRELHLGNTNMLLLMLLLLAADLIISGKQIPAGAFLGIAILFKPFLIILLLPVIMHKKWKAIVAFAIFMVLQFLVMILLWGPTHTLSLHVDWVSTILNHSNNSISNNSLAYLLDFYLGTGNIKYLNFIALIAVSILYLFLYFFGRQKRDRGPDISLSANEYMLLEFFLLMAVIPNILNTDTEHFLFSIPVIAVLVFYLFRKGFYAQKALLFVIFVFYGTNSNDLVGNTIGTFFDKIGAIGIANLALLTFMIIVMFKGLAMRIKDRGKPDST